MVVNCPNCDCPNDADQSSCRECGARIPWALRQNAIVPKQEKKQQRREYSDGDVVHRQEQARVVRKTGDDLIGRRQDVHSMRGGVKPVEGGISAYSPNQYAPPPAHETATRTESGRKFVDQQAYQQQFGYSNAPQQAPSYANQQAWQAEQGQNPYSAQQTYQAQAAAAHANHAQALGAPGAPQGGMPPAPQGPGAPQGGMPAAPHQQAHYQGQGGAPPPPSAGQAAAWQNAQLSVPSEQQTAQALAASSQADPRSALQASHGAPPAPARQGMPGAPMPSAPGRAGMPGAPIPSAPPRAGMPGAPMPSAPPRAGMPGAPMPSTPSRTGMPTAPGSNVPKAISGEAVITEPAERKAKASKPRSKRPTEQIALVFLDDSGNQRERLPMRPGKTIIGRTDGEVMLPSDPYVSPWHAQITVGRSNMIIKDMYSLNGIFRRISRQAQLHDGDRFQIGQQVLQFRHGWHDAEPDGQETKPLGGPHPSTAARVLVLTASNEVADLRLIRETLTIGRSGCDVNIPEDDSLEDKHVQIQRYGDDYLLIDLNSKDGVYLMIRGEAEIGHGDTIRIGRQRLLIERPGSAGSS